HGFQGPGGWYIENSLTTLGQKDPVSEYNSQLWNSGIEANKNIARKQKRRLTYVSNVYVLKDPANPQNENQVRLYKYGKKIWDKLNDKMNPEFADETPVNPFDLWEGANFKIKIRKVDGYSNYDKSEFENPTPLDEDENKMETVWKTEHSLDAFTDPKNFKTYTELKEKLDRVLGLSTGDTTETSTGPEAPRNAPFDGGSPYIPKEAVSPTPTLATAAGEETEEEMSYFKQLAED
ncbi:MAG TPA: single-stranded DNA-binding protein, partial [Dehalococcoidia bacterium]|nr:single-stranded DNA-binding protein [Dehalococcoidia bacterium]